MTRFSGTHSGKLDGKGRIAFPAALRNELDAAGGSQAAFRLSHHHPCIEVRSVAVFDDMIARLGQFDDFDQDADALATATLADTFLLRLDGDGRIVLPKDMLAGANLKDNLLFLGKGRLFEIWDETAAREHIAAARAIVRDKGLRLPATLNTPLNTTPRGMP
jgi:MraZ protein